MGYNYFRVRFYKEYVEHIFRLSSLIEKYCLTKERLRQKFVIAGTRINRYMTVNGNPEREGYTFYGLIVTEQDRKILAKGYRSQYEDTRWVKENHFLVSEVVDFLCRMNKIKDAQYVTIYNKENINVTEILIDEVTSMENLVPVLKHIEEEDLYTSPELAAIMHTSAFQNLIAEELKINWNDLGFLEKFIEKRSRIKTICRAQFPRDFQASYYILEFQTFDISARLYNSLCSSCITQIRDLLLFPYAEVKGIRNIGHNSLLELDSLLNSLGTSLDEIYPYKYKK